MLPEAMVMGPGAGGQYSYTPADAKMYSTFGIEGTTYGAEFLFIADTIPLPDESVDGAVSLTVFVEIRTMDAMRTACSEVARVLRRSSPFIVMSINPLAFGPVSLSQRSVVSTSTATHLTYDVSR
jgi:hypothetical protein